MRAVILRAAIAALVLATCSGRAVAVAASAWAWGYNYYGQIGDGAAERYRTTPVKAAGITGVQDVAGGIMHSVALLADGTVWAWGDNTYGQLGDGTSTGSAVPVQVVGLTDIVSIASGEYHCLAVRSDGTVWAWGRNQYGQIGDGSTTNRTSPVLVAGLTNVVAVSGGAQHSMALRSDGSVWAWGHNGYGQVGISHMVYPHEPVQVPGLSGVSAIACGGFHSLCVTADGIVWAWGQNNDGQLGRGTFDGGANETPQAVTGVSGAVAVAAGRSHSLAVTNNGDVWAWGDNRWGQLGDGTHTDRSSAGIVTGVSGAIRVAAGGYHSSALLADTTVWGWGDNGMGQLGDGTYTTRNHPVRAADIRQVRKIAAGFYHSLAAAELEVAATRLTTLDRTGIITDPVTLRGYLYRMPDNAPIEGRTIGYRVHGTSVGSAVTDSDGRASLNWAITDGPANRTIEAEFAGDPFYLGSTALATLTALTVPTKMWGLDRAGMITDTVLLRAYLWREDSVGIGGKAIAFTVDGTSVGSANTNSVGRAQLPYVIPDGAGAGTRPVVARWNGDGGYLSSACANTLYVQRAVPYLWVLPRSVAQGGNADLYAYFRRLFDYQPQPGKTVDFKLDGTVIQTVTSDANGVARYLYHTAEPPGVYAVRCQFYGDAWLEGGYGQAKLTIY